LPDRKADQHVMPAEPARAAPHSDQRAPPLNVQNDTPCPCLPLTHDNVRITGAYDRDRCFQLKADAAPVIGKGRLAAIRGANPRSQKNGARFC
jgi:hypothetical protein